MLVHRISDLDDEYAEKKAALLEIREEYLAEARKAGYVQGLTDYPSLKADSLNARSVNPRTRLHIVKDADEESA